MAKQMQTNWSFLREFISSPTAVGSVCPSSKALTSALIKAVPLHEPGIIIDLGAGTGIVSEELLKAGVPRHRILAVEKSPGFTKVFAQRCPNVPLIIGDACDLGSILAQHAAENKIAAIISSLPLRVIPRRVVGSIMHEVAQVLNHSGGIFIQYTYALWMQYPLRRYGFKSRSSSLVVRNLPPARVECYVV